MGLDNPLHIAFLVVILLLVFGARRLPEIGRSLGSGMREFKDSISGESKQPALPQATPQQPPVPVQPAVQAPAQPAPPPAAQQQAAEAFGTPPQPQPQPQPQQAPAEPTHQP
jgi:sec-independent protein translocase protein TatA